MSLLPRFLRPCLLALGLIVLGPTSLASAQSEEAAGGAGDGVDADDINKANNPLADMVSVNLHNYYKPHLLGVPDAAANTSWLRMVIPIPRMIIRASLPWTTVSSPGEVQSGLSDMNVFAAVLLTNPTAPVTIGAGPLAQMPTATDHSLGRGKWDLGAGFLWLYPNGPIMVGTLVTYQHSVGSLDWAQDDPANSILVIQPIANFQIGSGFYLRSVPIWLVDLGNETLEMPIGLGVGKVFKHGKTIFNLFIEPQYTFASKGVGAAGFQVFSGFNLQFQTGKGKKEDEASARAMQQAEAMRRMAVPGPVTPGR